MKKWPRISAVLLIIAAGWYGYCQWSEHSLRVPVEEARRQLRQKHFRTDISDFNFESSSEINARAKVVVAAGETVSLRHAHELELMEPVGTNMALAISSVEIVETRGTSNLWLLISGELTKQSAALDGACAALLAGPLTFRPTVKPRGDILLPYAAIHKRVARALSLRAALAIHERKTNDMFTNLLALSRMVTAWKPEPFEIVHLVRFSEQAIAQQALWESMQTDLWNETQLVALQREWESVRFFEGLPETAELACANMTRMCQTSREERFASISDWGLLCRGVFNSPISGFRNLWSTVQESRRHARYRNTGSYEDEKALLHYFSKQHEELKRASTCSTWKEMKSLPGATNTATFKGAENSRIGVLMNLKQMTLRTQGEGRTLLSRTAEAEAQRRLIVTAIALERFAIQHKAYPKSLAELVPAFLPAVPLDFMDGKELRYQRRADGRYLLYSVGLDVVDNGGQMVSPQGLRYAQRGGSRLSPPLDTDIVWPCPATQTEVDAYGQRSKKTGSAPVENGPEL